MYNFDQVITDIQQHEQLTIPLAAPYEGMEECHYHKLYSEVFLQPLSDESTISDLEERISKYFDDVTNVIPQLDREIDTDYELNIYSVDFRPLEEEASKFYATKVRFFAKVNHREQMPRLKESQDSPFLVVLHVQKDVRKTTFWGIKQNA